MNGNPRSDRTRIYYVDEWCRQIVDSEQQLVAQCRYN